jgi:spoIIIJ-associated protein
MMRKIEKSGKTVDIAIDSALKELNVSRNDVDVEVLEEANKGLFGFIGSKLAKVRLTVKETPTDKVKELLAKIFNSMDIKVNMEVTSREEHVIINLIGSDLGILIGRRGETLDALQYLVNLAANKNVETRTRFIIDVEGYRERREDTLKKLAQRLAEKAIRKGQNVILEPMNPHERRVIHTALQNNKSVETYSQGDEPYRKIIISPK